jgi:hypothetical protein
LYPSTGRATCKAKLAQPEIHLPPSEKWDSRDLFERNTVMLKIYVKASDLLSSLRSDKGGVVSFEYVIVAACIVTAVGIAFGNGAGGAIATALSGAITKIVSLLPPA